MLSRAIAPLAFALAAGCGSDGGLPGLGEPCSVLCQAGLDCSPQKFCVKSCRCDGDAGAPLCAPTALGSGCPPSAACVVEKASGDGECVARCGDLGCPPGEAACAAAPDGTPLCVGPGFPWIGLDGGADMTMNHD